MMKRKNLYKVLAAVFLSSTIVLSGCGGNTKSEDAVATTEAPVATTEALEELTFDQVKENIEAYINEQYSSITDKAVTTDDADDIVFVMNISGSLNTATNAKNGDADSITNWNNVVSNFESVSDTCYQYMSQYGYGDKNFGVMLVNDEDTDKSLLVAANGTVIYDVVNEIGTTSTDEENVEINPGDTFQVGDLSITFAEKELGFDPDDPYGLFELSDGYEYLKCSWTYTNNGSSDVYCSIYDFKCYADDTECEQKYLDSDFINTQLSSGRNVSFDTYYAVPKDAKTIELEYNTILGNTASAIIKVK